MNKDIEYLSRKLISEIEYNISQNYIRVANSHTLYVGRQREKYIDIDEVLKIRKQVYNLAKEKGISISNKNKYKKTLENIKESYNQKYQESQKLFDELLKRWIIIRDERGLHIGTSDDEFLNETTREYDWKLNELTWRNSPLSIVAEIKYRLDETLNKLQSADAGNLYKIFL